MTSEGRRWILGSFMGLLGVVGLFLASGAGSGGLYFSGLSLFGLAVLLIGYLVKRHYDEAE